MKPPRSDNSQLRVKEFQLQKSAILECQSHIYTCSVTKATAIGITETAKDARARCKTDLRAYELKGTR